MSEKRCVKCDRAPRMVNKAGKRLSMCVECQKEHWRDYKTEQRKTQVRPEGAKKRGRPRIHREDSQAHIVASAVAFVPSLIVSAGKRSGVIVENNRITRITVEETQVIRNARTADVVVHHYQRMGYLVVDSRTAATE